MQKKEASISYDEIKSVDQAKSMGFIQNVMIIVLNSGDEYKFVLGKRKEIMAYIESKMKGNE